MQFPSKPRAALMAVVAALATGAASAQQAPVIKLVVGYAPGGGADLMARTLAQALEPRLKATVIVENKPGAGGAIAAQALKAAPADGSTFMVTSDQFLITPLTLRSAGYDALADFQPVAGFSTFDICFAVNAQATPATTLAQHAAHVARNRKDAVYGVPAPGSLPQFYGYVAGKALGVPLQAVSYRGGAPMVADLVAGHIPAALGPCREMMAPYQSGKVRFLAAVQKVGWAPAVPTFAASGIAVGPSNWQAVFAPANAPQDRVEAMQQAIREAMADPALRERIAAAGFVPNFVARAELLEMSREASAFWSRHIRESGFVPQ